MISFDWKENCMLCGEKAKFDAWHPERNKIHNVTLLAMRENLLKHCDKRGDTWASEVQKRLYGCLDLLASEGNLPSKLLFKINKTLYQ